MTKKVGFRNNTAGVLSRELAAPPDGTVLHMSAVQGAHFAPPDGRDYVVATLGDPQTPAAFEIVHLSAPEFLSGSDEYAFQVERNQEATARVAPWPAGTPIQALLTAGGLHALQEQAPHPGQSTPAFQVGDIKTSMVAPAGSDWLLADGSTHSASSMPALAAALGISDGPPSAIAAVRTAADYGVGGDKQRGALTSPAHFFLSTSWMLLAFQYAFLRLRAPSEQGIRALSFVAHGCPIALVFTWAGAAVRFTFMSWTQPPIP
jgi:hypothetical protein